MFSAKSPIFTFRLDHAKQVHNRHSSNIQVFESFGTHTGAFPSSVWRCWGLSRGPSVYTASALPLSCCYSPASAMSRLAFWMWFMKLPAEQAVPDDVNASSSTAKESVLTFSPSSNQFDLEVWYG